MIQSIITPRHGTWHGTNDRDVYVARTCRVPSNWAVVPKEEPRIYRSTVFSRQHRPNSPF